MDTPKCTPARLQRALALLGCSSKMALYAFRASTSRPSAKAANAMLPTAFSSKTSHCHVCRTTQAAWPVGRQAGWLAKRQGNYHGLSNQGRWPQIWWWYQ